MDIVLENVQPGKTGHLRLLPNINRTGRQLPDTPSAGDLQSNAKVDNEFPTRKLSDKEIYSLMVGISDAEMAASAALTLEITFEPKLFTLLNPSGIPLSAQTASPVLIDLKNAKATQTKSRGIQFFIEARTFWGSPLVAPAASPTMAFRILDDKGVALLAQTTFSGADIRTADVILLGDSAPPERVFMCDVGENGPSLREFTDGARAAGVPLTIIPLELGNGDSWIQDQFQLGYTATQQAAQQVIVHLPRVANDSAIFAGTANLRNVVDTYLPSDAIAVMKDFWQITVDVNDGTSKITLDVPKSYVLYKQFAVLPRILQRLLSLLLEADPLAKPALPDQGDLYNIRLAIDTVYRRLLGYRSVKRELLDKIAGAKAAMDRLATSLAVKDTAVSLTIPFEGSNKTFTFDDKTSDGLNKLYADLYDLHSSRNYGGNIEVSPPTGDAPYGKILAGSLTSKDLIGFLTSRGTLHPLVTVFTDWLEVGHIDEISAFAPRPPDGFCALRASPKLAADMLDSLVALAATGVPVTRLFRGKKWIHTAALNATDPLPPPFAYVRSITSPSYDLSAFDTPIPKQAQPAFGDAAYHDDRQFLVLNRRAQVDARYAAMISCNDLLAVCRASNRAVEDLFLANTFAYSDDISYARYYQSDFFQKSVFPFRLDKIISDAFPGAPTYPIPVLFDYTSSFLNGQVSAITPAAINFQTLGTFVMVPRPYGPRLHIADAVAYTNALLKSVRYPKTSIDEKYIRSRGLDKTWHWTRSSERVSRADLANMPTDFDADFEASQSSKARAMLQAALSNTVLDMIAAPPLFDFYAMEHQNDPLKNHPVSEAETLYRIAGYFKDGFDAFKNAPVDFCKGDTESAHPKWDQYQTDIKSVMDQIAKANPGAFDPAGNVVSKDWVRLSIPEDTADVFELYTQLLMESLGLTVCWVDSWYYHTHKGGIHCGTNVLRNPAGP